MDFALGIMVPPPLGGHCNSLKRFARGGSNSHARLSARCAVQPACGVPLAGLDALQPSGQEALRQNLCEQDPPYEILTRRRYLQMVVA